MPTDPGQLPQSTPDEVRAMLRNAGVELPEELLRQFLAAWPNYEAMIRRIPSARAYGEEPAHVFRPGRMSAGEG